MQCCTPHARVNMRFHGYPTPPSCDCFMDRLAAPELDAAISGAVASANSSLLLLRGAMPSFSDFPRRKKTGWAFCKDPSPEGYGRLVEAQLTRALEAVGGAHHCMRAHGEAAHDVGSSYKQFVVVNAWNEWSEQAVIEPSQQLGHAFLRAHHQAIRNVTLAIRNVAPSAA